MESFAVDYPDVEFPSAAVVSPKRPRTSAPTSTSSRVRRGFVGHGAGFKDAIIETREAIPSDSALLLSGVATPENVATLVYAGRRPRGRRFRRRQRDARQLPHHGGPTLPGRPRTNCRAPARPASVPVEEFTREHCVEHNVNALRAELAHRPRANPGGTTPGLHRGTGPPRAVAHRRVPRVRPAVVLRRGANARHSERELAAATEDAFAGSRFSASPTA